MEPHSEKPVDKIERLNLREQAWPLYLTMQILGVVGLVGTVVARLLRPGRFQAVLLLLSGRIPFLPGDRAGRAVLRHAATCHQGRLERERSANRRVVRVIHAADGGPVGPDRGGGASGPGPALSLGAAAGLIAEGIQGVVSGPARSSSAGWCSISCSGRCMGVWYWKQSVKQDETRRHRADQADAVVARRWG